MAVQAAFYTQNRGKRHFVHLLNELNSTANRALPVNNPSMRMEVIPIHDIKITVKEFKPSKAFLVPGNQPLKITPAGNGAEVTVPKLGTHAIVVFEYAGPENLQARLNRCQAANKAALRNIVADQSELANRPISGGKWIYLNRWGQA